MAPNPPCRPAAGAGAAVSRSGAPPVSGSRSGSLPSPSSAASRLHLPRLPSPPPLSCSGTAFLTPAASELHPSDEALAAMSPREQTALLSRQRHWRRARDLFDRLRALPGYASNPFHYSVLLRHLARARRWAELRGAWLGMPLPPTNPAYAALADALAKAGMARESILLLHHMRARGVAPDEVSMNTFVRVLKDERRYANALALFSNWCDGRFEVDFLDLDCSAVDSDGPMQFLLAEIRDGKFSAAGGASDLDGVPRKPKLVATYNTIIDLYGKAGRLKDALDMFVEMPANGVTPDTYTFNTLVNVFGLSSNIGQAGALFASMLVRGINPDIKTYNVMMTLFASIGNLEDVLTYYHQIGKTGLCADSVSYRIVLQALCERKMVQDVEDIIEGILNSGSSVCEQSLPVVMKMYVDLGLLDEANAFFERHCRGKGVSSKNFAAILNTFAEKGLWEEAEHVFYSERDGNKDIVEYNVMVKVYGRAKQYDSVSSLIESMKESGIPLDDCTYNSSIQMFSTAGFPQRAKQLLDEMKDAGFEPKCATYSAIIRSYASHYLVSEAVDLFNEMKTSAVEPNIVVYGLLIDMFAEIGNLKKALYYSNLMEESGISPNKIVLTSLIKAYGKVDCWKEAQELYSRMKNMDGGPDIIASNALLNLYANLGMVTKSKEIFDSLRRNSRADDVSHTTMIYLYKSVGLLTESIKIAHDLHKSGLLSDHASYNAVLASYLAEGSLRDYAELVQQMVAANIPLDAATLGMIFSLLKKGHVSKEEILQLESAYNDERNSVKQAIVALLFSVAGLHAAALDICEQLLRSERTIDPCACNVCFKVYASCGKIEKAFSLFMRMNDLGLKLDTVTCIDLTTCYRKHGMSERLRTNGVLEYRNGRLIMPSHNAVAAFIETRSDVAIQLVKK